MSERRVGERGLSLMEAIIVVTITAVLALLIMPLLPRAASGSASVAGRGIDALDQMRAEREFRTLIRAVSPRQVEGVPEILLAGDANGASLRPTLNAAVACARPGAPIVRLIVEQLALVCISEGRRRVLLRWQNGQSGTLSYSPDGVAWRADWDVIPAPHVRFELRRGASVQARWSERAVGAAP